MRFNDLISHILLPAIILCGVQAPGGAFAQSVEQVRQYRVLHGDDEYVISPARRLTPIDKSPGNITIIRSGEIMEMNAHTVAEVLSRAPGVFVNFFGMDVGSPSLTYMEGSEERNVLFLLDGSRLNFLNSGSAEANMIPVGAIERIEIIRGAASSSWGSSLAGVINIILKRGESLTEPGGLVQGSVGENHTHDLRAEISGGGPRTDYFAHIDFLTSDGLEKQREFKKCGIVTTFRHRLSSSSEIGFSILYSEPTANLGDLPTLDISTVIENHTFFAAGSLDIALKKGMDLSLSFHHLKHKLTQLNGTMGGSGPAGNRYLDGVWDEAATGARGKLIFKHGANTGAFGVDYFHGSLDQTLESGRILQEEDGAPPTLRTNPSTDEWAAYVNYTIDVGNWAIVPGFRYDWSDITGSFLSPSLGAAYQPEILKDTILRLSVARGFSDPPLAWTSGGALFLDPNPSLKREEAWSFQTGIESNALKYLHIKATAFRHETENFFIKKIYTEPEQRNSTYVHGGDVIRQGLEFEAETVSFFNFSLWTGVSYINLEPDGQYETSDIYKCDIALRYEDDSSYLRAELFGHYIYWDLHEPWDSVQDDFIWDLNISKKVWVEKGKSITVFLTGHNLLNGSQYIFSDYKNPGRWFEIGVRWEY